jgi:GNAT superfamily N-acetyltransferase
MDDIITDMASPALVPALEANMRDFMVAYGTATGCEMYRSDGLVQSITSVPFPLYNMIHDTRLTAATADRAIAAAVARIAPRQVPMFWCVGPSTEPADLPDRLGRHHFMHTGGMPGMAVALDSLPEQNAPEDLIVRPVDDAASLTDWIVTLLASYDAPAQLADPIFPVEASLLLARPHPERRYYVGYRGDRPVAASALQMSGGVAGIMAVGTLHEERGRGIGAALTLAALYDARDAGYRVGVLQATEMGYPVYRRLGFEDVCTIDLYLWHSE